MLNYANSYCSTNSSLKEVLLILMKKQVAVNIIGSEANGFIFLPYQNQIPQNTLFIIDIKGSLVYISTDKGGSTKLTIPLNNISLVLFFSNLDLTKDLNSIVSNKFICKEQCYADYELYKEIKEYFNYYHAFLPFINFFIKGSSLTLDKFSWFIILILLFFDNAKANKLIANNELTISTYNFGTTNTTYLYSIVPIKSIDFLIYPPKTTSIKNIHDITSLDFNEILNLDNISSFLKDKDLDSLLDEIKVNFNTMFHN